MLKRRAIGLVSVAALALCGCAGAMMNNPREELKLAIEEFNGGIRWDKVEQSAAHLPLARRQSFAERYGALTDELELLDYDVQRVEFDRQKDEARVRVEVSWSLKRRGIVERTVVEEHWEHPQGVWLLTSSKRLRGTPLPILE